jgi:hypothetical protein
MQQGTLAELVRMELPRLEIVWVGCFRQSVEIHFSGKETAIESWVRTKSSKLKVILELVGPQEPRS